MLQTFSERCVCLALTLASVPCFAEVVVRCGNVSVFRGGGTDQRAADAHHGSSCGVQCVVKRIGVLLEESPKRLHSWVAALCKDAFEKVYNAIAESVKAMDTAGILTAASSTPVRVDQLKTHAKSAEVLGIVNSRC